MQKAANFTNISLLEYAGDLFDNIFSKNEKTVLVFIKRKGFVFNLKSSLNF